MKTPSKNPNKNYGLPVVFLAAVLAWLVGCASPNPNPLANWKSIGNISYRVNPEGSFLGSDPCDQAIIDDVKDFIQTFPPQERGAGAGPFQLYEDGTGQHAVSFEVFVGPYTSWHYTLFYDKENKRVKVMKYGKTQHMS